MGGGAASENALSPHERVRRSLPAERKPVCDDVDGTSSLVMYDGACLLTAINIALSKWENGFHTGKNNTILNGDIKVSP